MVLDPASDDPTAALAASLPVAEARPPGGPMRARVTGGWSRFKRLTRVGLPPRFPIVQFPNLPLIAGLLATAVADRTHGSERTYAKAVAYLALAVWAYEELARGVNWFRRVLGAAVLVILIVSVAHGLRA